MRFPATRPIRCLITEGVSTSENIQIQRIRLLDGLRQAVDIGIELVQIREKRLPTRLLYEVTASAAEIVKGSETRLLVNERFDVAIAGGADGVHLTSKSLPVADVRTHVPRKFIIGVSTHSAEEVAAAKENGADFAIFGPIFPTPGKGEAKGVKKLREVCTLVSPLPVLAVGGVGAESIDSLLSVGARGFASIRYLNEFVRIAR